MNCLITFFEKLYEQYETFLIEKSLDVRETENIKSDFFAN